MREAAVVIDGWGQVLHWHLPTDRTATRLPDSAGLWAVCWTHRDVLAGIAHSHPGEGVPIASQEDLTTFSALERGLGRRLTWWITSGDVLVCMRWMGPGRYDYGATVDGTRPAWLAPLRDASKEEKDEREPGTPRSAG